MTMTIQQFSLAPVTHTQKNVVNKSRTNALKIVIYTNQPLKIPSQYCLCEYLFI